VEIKKLSNNNQTTRVYVFFSMLKA